MKPYLGKTDLYWCLNCNLPLLGKTCGKCHEKGKKIILTPPGDARPAFPSDIKLINETIKAQYGCELIPEDKIVILNNAPGEDRFDEIVMDSEIIGAIRYDIKLKKFIFLPSLEGAIRIWKKSRKKYVTVDHSAKEHILKGSGVLIPGVREWDEEIERGEEVIVVCGEEVIGVGKAKLSGKEVKKVKKGIFVRLRRKGSIKHPNILKGGQNWDDVVEANRDIIRSYEKRSIEFIKRIIKNKKNFAVAFSGGKDSLATLLLVMDAIGKPEVIFTDTGLEYPETLEYVRKISKNLKIKIRILKSENFWKALEYFGVPARDYRWCCKVIKLGPIAKFIKQNYGNKLLCFIGQRKYESKIRSKSKDIWINPWLPSQVGASPIQNWKALHVWLYLMEKKVEINPLYFKGIKRIGCWLCPASDLAEFEVLKNIHPKLWKKWRDVLEEYGLSLEEGKWRWRRNDIKTFKYEYRDGKVFGELDISYQNFSNLAKIFDSKIGEDFIFISGIKVYTNGKYEFYPKNETEIYKKLWILVSLAERSKNCFNCGICEAQCKYNAITVNNGGIEISSNCTHCLACHYSCPIVKYGVSKIRFIQNGRKDNDMQ